MGFFQDLKDKALGTEQQNKESTERMAKEDAKSPDTVQAKVNRAVESIKPTKEPVKKAKGGMIGSASKRADGCATKGKTRGRMV